MSDHEIQCPSCGEAISLSGALTKQIEDKYEKQFLKQSQKAEADFKDKVALEKITLEKKIREQIDNEKIVQLQDLQNQLSEKERKLELSRQSELELLKKGRQLEEKEKSLEIELMKKLSDEKLKMEEVISKRVADEQRLRVAEKDKQLDDMRRQIEELKRRSELTSQQLQGEVLELQLECELKKYFPQDIIEPVAKGARGGDIVEKVMTHSGIHVGTIIWETKRTKSWSDTWVDKLKDDQRAIAAEFAIIVSEILPKDITGHGLYDGVWVSNIKSVQGIATALRVALVQVNLAKASVAGKDEKMESVYTYLTGTHFAQRIQSVVETFRDMKDGLDTERVAFEKIWARREKQIEKVLRNTVAVYGSIQGIVGGALPKISALELPSGASDEGFSSGSELQ